MDTNNNQHEQLRFSGLAENKDALLQVLNKAKSTVRWFSPDLDCHISDNEEVCRCLLDFCKSNSKARLEILLHDPKALAGRGHRLINLSQRLTTPIKIKHTNQDSVKSNPSSFIVVDDKHIYWKPVSSIWQGHLKLDAPLIAKTWACTFKEAWEISEPDSELRRISL